MNSIDTYMDTLKNILKTMDIPENRKQITFGNLNWMRRNLGFRNAQNPKFKEAMDTVNILINCITQVKQNTYFRKY